MGDFFSFRRMITPVLIQIVFWIGVVVSVIAGLVQLVGDQPFVGLLTLVFGPLIVRIYCELLILFFRMNETLTDVRNALTGQTPNGQTVVPTRTSIPGGEWGTAHGAD